MTNTAISTAARRIVRELNSRRTGFSVYFDSSGHQVAETFGPETFGPNASSYFASFTTTPDRWTQRLVQDHLDAETAARTVGGGHDLAAELLASWSTDDEIGRPRTTVQRHLELQAAVDADLRAEGLL